LPQVAVATPQTRLEIILFAAFHLLVCFAPNGNFILACGQRGVAGAERGLVKGEGGMLLCHLQRSCATVDLIYGQRAWLECLRGSPLSLSPLSIPFSSTILFRCPVSFRISTPPGPTTMSLSGRNWGQEHCKLQLHSCRA